MRIWHFGAALVSAFAAFVFVNNTALLDDKHAAQPTLLAHRGLHQVYSREGQTNQSCTAAMMLPTSHRYLENTLPSMRAAFAMGAQMVELDIHPTTDGQFAVFHDWTVDCRTEGKGVTREHTMAALKALDIGYGYTADGGKTFPFRGAGVGLMPSLAEVLTEFPTQHFLIHVKGNDPQEAEQLAAFLKPLSAENLARLSFYGGDAPIAGLRAIFPGMRLMSRATLKSCVLRYAALGWTGTPPEACANMLLIIPINYAPWLWGWPNKLVDRMAAVGSPVFVAGHYTRGEPGQGLNGAESWGLVPLSYRGGVWTDRLEIIAPAMAAR